MTELDLTCNLIHSWNVAEGLSTALPQLKASGDGDLEWECCSASGEDKDGRVLEVLSNK